MRSGKLPVILVVAALFATTVVFNAEAAAKITVNQTADKVTVTGGAGKKIASQKFALSKDAWYVIKISYTGATVSTCQLSLATQEMIDKKDTVGGLLTNWMGPSTTEEIKYTGSLKTADYMIYVDEAEGPWTVQILKSPKPTTVSSSSTFSGTSSKVTPFFHLKKGAAKFTIHQKRKGKGVFASRLQVDLVNADTGALVSYLCHNSTEETQTAKADIAADGNYVLAVSDADSWDVSFTQ
jgi:hypothetical protein